MDQALLMTHFFIAIVLFGIFLRAFFEAYIFFRHRFLFARKKYATPTLFLKKQKRIRIVVDNAPAYGNQVASMNVAMRLRQIGFSGIFEFIYPETVMPKIAKLFQLPESLGPFYFDTNRKIEFIQLQHFINQQRQGCSKRLVLGLTGAFDKDKQQLLTNDTLDADYLYNFANLLNVNAFIEWQPFLDNEGDTAIFIRNQNEPITQKGSHKKFFPLTSYDFSDMKRHLFHTSEGQHLLQIKPALAQLIQSLENEAINFLPVYGYHFLINNWRRTQHFPEHLLEVLLGARYAQMKGKKGLEKPLIVAVFYEYQKETQALRHLLEKEDWGEYEKPGAKEARELIATFQLTENLVTADLNDPDCGKQIEALKPGQLLLLSVGILPKIVFDGLYTHFAANVLPPIREGANSFNQLIVKGRPHIRCHDKEDKVTWELGFQLGAKEVNERLAAFYQHTFKGMEKWGVNQPIPWIGEFFIDAFESNPSLLGYFAGLKEAAFAPENDRIQAALTTFLLTH